MAFSPNTGGPAGVGWDGGQLYWNSEAGAADATLLIFDMEVVITGTTVSGAFGSQLNSGALTVWTHGISGDTISFVAVPEPSSALLVGLGGIGLLVRRRRA